jgi:YegS/Rv2252/BmrU family lipid kinase
MQLRLRRTLQQQEYYSTRQLRLPHHNTDLTNNIAILCNPIAGKGKSLRLAHTLVQQLQQRKITHTLFTNNWPAQLTGFTQAWIVGGDGTLNYTLNQYADEPVAFAIFKGGTGNDVAWKLYGDCSTEAQFEKVLNATPRAIDAGRCNDKYFINGTGIGFDGEVLRAMGAIRWLGGHLGYLLIVLLKILSFRERQFRIRTSNSVSEQKLLLLMVTNSPRTGGGFMVSPQADITDGLLNLITCQPLSVLRRFRYLPVIEKGKHLQLPFIHHQTLTSIYIQCAAPTYAQLDGELICATAFDIRVLPGRFLFCY